MRVFYELLRDPNLCTAPQYSTVQYSTVLSMSHYYGVLAHYALAHSHVETIQRFKIHTTSSQKISTFFILTMTPAAYVVVWLVLCLSSATSTVSGIPKQAKKIKPVVVKQKTAFRPFQSRFDRVVQNIFDDADTNNDGSISFGECYELVLKLYIKINRQAPIPPPTRKTVLQLYQKNDTNRNKRLSRNEFTALAQVLGGRAATRLAAHKFVTLVCAPLLAEFLVRQLTGRKWLPELAIWIVPDRYELKVLPIITSKAVMRTVIMIGLMGTLGNFIIGTVNWILDIYTLMEEE
jgi:hypothetical protein